jgi:hypothetical protein
VPADGIMLPVGERGDFGQSPFRGSAQGQPPLLCFFLSYVACWARSTIAAEKLIGRRTIRGLKRAGEVEYLKTQGRPNGSLRKWQGRLAVTKPDRECAGNLGRTGGGIVYDPTRRWGRGHAP